MVDNVFEEHGLTEDGKTVAPIFTDFCSKITLSLISQTYWLQVVSLGPPRPFGRETLRLAKRSFEDWRSQAGAWERGKRGIPTESQDNLTSIDGQVR